MLLMRVPNEQIRSPKRWAYLTQNSREAIPYVIITYIMKRRRVSSVVKHSSANSKVSCLIPGPVSYQGHGLWWGMYNASYSWSGPQLPKGCGCIWGLSSMHKRIPDSYSKREGGNPGNSGLSSQQQLEVHYPRTVWKNSYAKHEVTGKTYNL